MQQLGNIIGETTIKTHGGAPVPHCQTCTNRLQPCLIHRPPGSWTADSGGEPGNSHPLEQKRWFSGLILQTCFRISLNTHLPTSESPKRKKEQEVSWPFLHDQSTTQLCTLVSSCLVCSCLSQRQGRTCLPIDLTLYGSFHVWLWYPKKGLSED